MKRIAVSNNQNRRVPRGWKEVVPQAGSRVLLLLAAVLLFNRQSFAAPSSYASATGNGGFLFNLAASLNSGSDQTSDNASVRNREMMAFMGTAWAGYSFGMIAPIVSAEYRMAGQTTDAGSVGGSNTGGTATGYGAGLQFDISRVKLLAAYVFNSNYSLTKKTDSGQSASYKNGSGYHVELLFHLTASWLLGLNYLSVNYPTYNAGTDQNIKANKFNETFYGLTIGFSVF